RLEQRQVHGGALDVERLVVLDHGHGAQRIERARRNVDRLTQHLESRALQELARLASIVAVAVERQRERLETRGRLALIEQQLVEAEQHGAAVDPARERHANWGGRILGREPTAQLGVQRLNVVPADQIQIGRQRAARWIKEALVDGIGVGTANELQ